MGGVRGRREVCKEEEGSVLNGYVVWISGVDIWGGYVSCGMLYDRYFLAISILC